MIYSLTGKLIHTDPNMAVISCSGVAFKCFVSMNTLRELPAVGNEATVYTYLNVKEDALDLYGFAGEQEMEYFKLLLSISGVGPKAAMAILSQLSPDRFALAVASGDAKAISAAQGVGAKTAQRVVLELKDKIGSVAVAGDVDEVRAASSVSASSNAADAVSALVSLGYSRSEASLAVGRLDSSLSADVLIKEALKSLSKML